MRTSYVQKLLIELIQKIGQNHSLPLFPQSRLQLQKLTQMIIQNNALPLFQQNSLQLQEVNKLVLLQIH
ncbi:hypothetical protein JTE90_021388 [Oedothorax gibbosus]|uniref:Uncharacterized protein n=1 Tax=Oedothorax gibbosus TaxID=931172 RepID=A0AAV6VFY3_9ARAC|nr:hypothetical protein JTE90_021388 [Oedothorax gibbosus]